MNDFIMFSSNRWDKESSTHSIILFLEVGFIFPSSVNWWALSLSHWSYSSVILALNGLFQHTSGGWIYFVHPSGVITLSTFISFKSFPTQYGVRKGPKAKSHLLYDKAPKIHFTQQIAVSFSFIQVLPELLTAQWNLNSLSSDLNSLLVARKTTSGFNLVPSALAATHMLTIHLYAQLSSNKQILLLVYWL